MENLDIPKPEVDRLLTKSYRWGLAVGFVVGLVIGAMKC